MSDVKKSVKPYWKEYFYRFCRDNKIKYEEPDWYFGMDIQ